MINVIGLRGDELRYREESYSYDLERKVWLGNNSYWIPNTTCVIDYPNCLVEKGAHWTYNGTGLSLKELLETRSK